MRQLKSIQRQLADTRLICPRDGRGREKAFKKGVDATERKREELMRQIAFRRQRDEEKTRQREEDERELMSMELEEATAHYPAGYFHDEAVEDIEDGEQEAAEERHFRRDHPEFEDADNGEDNPFA